MTEEWRDIPGFEGIYQASNTGKIRTCEGKTTESVWHGTRHWKQREIKQKYQRRKKGHNGRKDARVTLYKEKKQYTFLVSRLIALAWCPGADDGLTVNHIDGNPMNNNAENLEWVSLKENIRKGFGEGLYSSCVRCNLIDSQGGKYEFVSMSQADAFLGKNANYISWIRKSGKKTAQGENGETYLVEFPCTCENQGRR